MKIMNKTGIELIADERKRQIEVEGWTPEHDALHKNGELADAAACYAGLTRRDHKFSFRVPNSWPFRIFDWKPTPNDRVRELVKAGALIAAEIDRIQNQ